MDKAIDRMEKAILTLGKKGYDKNSNSKEIKARKCKKGTKDECHSLMNRQQKKRKPNKESTSTLIKRPLQQNVKDTSSKQTNKDNLSKRKQNNDQIGIKTCKKKCQPNYAVPTLAFEQKMKENQLKSSHNKKAKEPTLPFISAVVQGPSQNLNIIIQQNLKNLNWQNLNDSEQHDKRICEKQVKVAIKNIEKAIEKVGKHK